MSLSSDSNADRYWDRLERKESYVFFLRRTNNIEQSYYTLEVEPGGTIRVDLRREKDGSISGRMGGALFLEKETEIEL